MKRLLAFGLACTFGLTFVGCAAPQAPVKAPAPTRVPHKVSFQNRQLRVDGKVVPIRVSAFHYWRLPSQALWSDELARLKTAGYNAVAIDFYWGYHSPRPGAYDFSGVRDVNALLDMAAQQGMYVIALPGPFIEADADASGLPDWVFAQNTESGSIASRYARESRQWMNKVNAILARHQLTNGTGSVVLYDVAERDAAVPSLEREARANGITVPFARTTNPTGDEGIHWGWTGDPLGFYARHTIAVDTAGRALPEITGWRSHTDDAEAQRVFDDQAWPTLTTALPVDTDEAKGSDTDGDSDDADDDNDASPAAYLGVDDYGFHHGAVWYRGHFIANGGEHTFSLDGMSGRGGMCAVWLNGSYLGSAAAGTSGSIATTLRVTAAVLRPHADNVISVLFENMGHNEELGRDLSRVQPRGMMHATLGAHPSTIEWHILGNGEYNVDAVRGQLNSGGLGGEIAGWQRPEFSDAAWSSTTLPAHGTRAGVTWYRAHVTLNEPDAKDMSIGVHLNDAQNSHYRALVFVNGWLIGQYVSDWRDRAFPVPTGILQLDGNNTIAIAAWNLDGTSGLGAVSLTRLKTTL